MSPAHYGTVVCCGNSPQQQANLQWLPVLGRWLVDVIKFSSANEEKKNTKNIINQKGFIYILVAVSGKVLSQLVFGKKGKLILSHLESESVKSSPARSCHLEKGCEVSRTFFFCWRWKILSPYGYLFSFWFFRPREGANQRTSFKGKLNEHHMEVSRKY